MIIDVKSVMARQNVPLTNEYPYHITARTTNREKFHVPMNTIWQLMEMQLYQLKMCYDVQIYSFVLMPNHFHLILSSPEFELGYVMQRILVNVSKEINYAAGRINQNWGDRYFKCILSSYHYYLNCYKYVYQNPVRAGLVEKCEDWQFSTLNGVLGINKLLIPIEEDTILFNPNLDFEQLNWLNTKISEDNAKDMKLALAKKSFKLKNTDKKRPHALERHLI